MKCPLCEVGELRIHISLEPSFTLRKGDMETNLPQIVAIQCNSGCVYPVGELLFKAVELIYWNDIRHLERLDLLRAKTGHEVEAENRAYLDNVKLLKATLDEAVRRYKRDDGFHPNG